MSIDIIKKKLLRQTAAKMRMAPGCHERNGAERPIEAYCSNMIMPRQQKRAPMDAAFREG
jgi:hypothetical protein